MVIMTNPRRDHTPESGEVRKHKYRCTTNTQHDEKEGVREGLQGNFGAMEINPFSKVEAN